MQVWAVRSCGLFGFGRRDAAGGACQQPKAKPFLKPADGVTQGRDGRYLPVREDVDDTTPLQIADDRAVTMTALPALPWLSKGCAVGTLASVAQSSMPTTRGAATGCGA